jgi:hypothetical protein
MNRLLRRQAAPKAATVTARGPHECVALTHDQFRGAMEYVTRAALTAVRVPQEFFNGTAAITILKGDDSKRTLLAAHVYFRSDGQLSLSFFYRYMALGALASSTLLKPWVFFDPAHDNFAAFHPALMKVCASIPLDRTGRFDPQVVRDAAALISEGFPQPLQPAVPTEDAASSIDQRIAA